MFYSTAIKESEILNKQLSDCSYSFIQFVEQMSCYLREYKSQFSFTLSGWGHWAPHCPSHAFICMNHCQSLHLTSCSESIKKFNWGGKKIRAMYNTKLVISRVVLLQNVLQIRRTSAEIGVCWIYHCWKYYRTLLLCTLVLAAVRGDLKCLCSDFIIWKQRSHSEPSVFLLQWKKGLKEVGYLLCWISRLGSAYLNCLQHMHRGNLIPDFIPLEMSLSPPSRVVPLFFLHISVCRTLMEKDSIKPVTWRRARVFL